MILLQGQNPHTTASEICRSASWHSFLPRFDSRLRWCLGFALSLSTVFACGGCYTHVVHSAATDKGTGIRYYQSSPYLLVYSDSKNGLQWQILYLPDQTKMMMVTPQVVGGRSEVDLYFHNGVLTGSSELSDTTELPKAIITAVQSAIPLLFKVSVAPEGVPSPYLFKIVVKGEDITFVGRRDESVTIRVPKSQVTKP